MFLSNKGAYLIKGHFLTYPVIVKLSQSLNLSLSLRDRDRADTIITFHPPTHQKLFKHLEMTYIPVWYIIVIVSSRPTHIHSKK